MVLKVDVLGISLLEVLGRQLNHRLPLTVSSVCATTITKATRLISVKKGFFCLGAIIIRLLFSSFM